MEFEKEIKIARELLSFIKSEDACHRMFFKGRGPTGKAPDTIIIDIRYASHLAEALLAMHEELERREEWRKVQASTHVGLYEQQQKLQSALEDAIDVRDAFIAKNEMLEGENKKLVSRDWYHEYLKLQADLKGALCVIRYIATYSIPTALDCDEEELSRRCHLVRNEIQQRAREFIARHEGKE